MTASRSRALRRSKECCRNIWKCSVEPGRPFMVSRDEFALANQRAENVWSSFPKAVSAHYDRRLGRVLVRLSSGLDVGFSPRETQGLEHARPGQLRRIDITPSGFGIHFPELDADIYLPTLLQGFRGSRKWMAARLGTIGGKS